MPNPIRPASTTSPASSTELPADTPEALMISALLESGSFDPAPFGVSVDDLDCWDKLWTFCTDYHSREGVAPPLNLVGRKFPDFTLTEGVGLNYASNALRNKAHQRTLSSSIGRVISALKEDDLDTAHTLIESISRPRSMRKPALDGFSHDNFSESFDVTRIPVPHFSLGRVSGGIGTGELWYVAARPANGKTYTACTFVAEAVRAGRKVAYVSAEMPAHRINQRIARVLTRGDKKLLTDLASKDRLEQKAVLDTLRDRVSGSWATVDPSHGKMTNAFIREQMYDVDLVVVDHMGLLRTNKGHRAIDDWRAMADISNTLREDNLAVGTPVLGLVQISRSGENTGMKPPKGSTLSQSDSLLQDCDVLVTMKRLSKHVMVHSAEKVRENDTPIWWSKYDPAKIDFSEISKDRAMEIVATDDAFDEE